MIKTALLAALALAGPVAQATSVTIGPDGAWNPFDVTPDLATSGGLEWIDSGDGSPLTFNFSVPGGHAYVLNIVDAGYAGDVFSVSVNGGAPFLTSAAVNTYPDSVRLDFDAAFANAKYSKASRAFTAGSYAVTGLLATSALDDLGHPINATVGALQLLPVPEPTTYASMIAGLALLAGVLRRRVR